MQHQIQIDSLRERVGAFAPAMGEAVHRCVHCGFCLANCPTYRVTGEEAESPRGRILLMKEALEGSLDVEAASRHVDGCLGCVACVTSCPSGVEYGELMVPFRAWAHEKRAPASLLATLRRKAMLGSLVVPGRLRWALRLGRIARPFRALMPSSLQAPLDLLPRAGAPRAGRMPQVAGARRARVALLRGCAQSVLEPGINQATEAVFARNGVEVLGSEPGCCGALEQHVGELQAAAARATPLVRSLAAAVRSGDVDAVVTTAAGCGSGIAEYPLLFGGTELEGDARVVAEATVDCTRFLADLGLTQAGLRLEPGRKVAVHDACHLAHAQRETAAPRALLAAVEGVTLVEPHDAALCCGSAGTYNIEQPEMAAELGRRKAQALAETGADWIATGNIGCLTQVRHHLHSAEPRVLHTMQILDLAAADGAATGGES